MEKKWARRDWTIGGLMLIIFILLGFISYSMILKPKFNKYILEKQIEAQREVVQYIIGKIEAQGYIELIKSENNSVILVPYSPQQTESAT